MILTIEIWWGDLTECAKEGIRHTMKSSGVSFFDTNWDNSPMATVEIDLDEYEAERNAEV